MKFTQLFVIASAAFAATSVSAHSSMKNPLPRGHPLNPNAAVHDSACITAPLNGGIGCAPKSFPCGGYPQDTKITQVFDAGEVINAQFWNPNFPDGPTDPNANQGRHNGGLVEFSLSYDGGKTFTVIATYHKTAPDIFFDWKVKIPENAPSCDTAGDCLFSWSWINAVGNREFYQNCADIKIKGNSTKPLPIIDITRANLASAGFDTTLTPEGDPANTGNAKGSGPSDADVQANLALNIGGGSSSGGSSGGSSGSGSSGSDSGSATTTTTTSSSKATDTPKDSPTATTSADDSTPTTSGGSGGSNVSSDGSCTDGEMTCVEEGTSPGFNTCANGQNVLRQCPGGTVCSANGSSIQCVGAKRSFFW